MKSLSSFAVLLLAGGTLAANPVFNGSFELGTDGFALEKELRTDTNPGLKFIPLKVTDQAPGSCFLKIPMRNTTTFFQRNSG